MILKKFLKNIKIPIAILTFNDYDCGKLYSQEYDHKEFKNISDELLRMEVMETSLEENCMEIWLK